MGDVSNFFFLFFLSFSSFLRPVNQDGSIRAKGETEAKKFCTGRFGEAGLHE